MERLGYTALGNTERKPLGLDNVAGRKPPARAARSGCGRLTPMRRPLAPQGMRIAVAVDRDNAAHPRAQITSTPTHRERSMPWRSR
jgi:hypothetical protein